MNSHYLCDICGNVSFDIYGNVSPPYLKWFTEVFILIQFMYETYFEMSCLIFCDWCNEDA